MSGHSKWATTKHRKGAQDKARAKLFAKLIRQVEVAAREGGGDVSANANLRAMYQKARDGSVPLDTIERAIKRGTGELDGVRYEQVTYEGYGPGGVAVLVDTLTDNRNRTGAEMRSIFSRNGGSMAEPGAVAWQFERKGSIEVGRDVDEDTLMELATDAGAEDLESDPDGFSVTTAPGDLATVREALEAKGVTVKNAELTMVPTTTIEVGDESEAKRVLRLMDAIDDHDDVQNVHANFDIPEAVLAAYDG
ncbi:MAG TPA: YebC/PmpR family DNA-binding transcriptional regulator [Acidimicrobiales bacterium]|jgi:YebC/PmpR family DNA-binding regulatory protein|nr:YebC/PmpR family DNA-binding transcriptional regulator [Acidimicrobiales bacterium]